jgi:hypothetical protein
LEYRHSLAKDEYLDVRGEVTGGWRKFHNKEFRNEDIGLGFDAMYIRL